MIYKIKFKKLQAVCLDFVPNNDGFYYLRMVGPETVVNAIWARLSGGNDYRGTSSESGVRILGGHREEGASLMKSTKYKTIRVRLPGGMVDIAMIHPVLTVIEDNSRGFNILTYDEGVPGGFFHRLNRSLPIPLLPEWESWLWSEGLKLQSFRAIKKDWEWRDGIRVEFDGLTGVDKTPIYQLSSIGTAVCYRVTCADKYRQAWLHLIRQQLGLGISLVQETSNLYRAGQWAVVYEDSAWQVMKGDEIKLSADSIELALIRARQELGTLLII